jgi:hypothetical protein
MLCRDSWLVGIAEQVADVPLLDLIQEDGQGLGLQDLDKKLFERSVIIAEGLGRVKFFRLAISG